MSTTPVTPYRLNYLYATYIAADLNSRGMKTETIKTTNINEDEGKSRYGLIRDVASRQR